MKEKKRENLLFFFQKSRGVWPADLPDVRGRLHVQPGGEVGGGGRGLGGGGQALRRGRERAPRGGAAGQELFFLLQHQRCQMFFDSLILRQLFKIMDGKSMLLETI